MEVMNLFLMNLKEFQKTLDQAVILMKGTLFYQ